MHKDVDYCTTSNELVTRDNNTANVESENAVELIFTEDSASVLDYV